MKTQIKHIFSIILVCLIITGVFTGCKKNNEDSSSDSTAAFESEIVVPDSSDDSTPVATDSSDNQISSQPTTSTPTPADDGKVDPKKYAGTTVTYATWKDPALNEDGPVVKSFQKKYGIKVKIDLIPERDYIKTVASRIVSGNAPDIVFDNGMFPNSLQVLQPIEAAKLDLSESIWDKDFINHVTLNGKPYLVNTISNIWNEYVILYYNKKIFKNYNIKTPEQYYAEGNWTWDTMEAIMKEVRQKSNKKITGALMYQNAFLSTLGTDFYTYDPTNHKFLNGTSNPTFKAAMKKLASWRSDGLVDSGNFNDGTFAMTITDLFGLKKTGYFTSMNASDIGYTYAPDFDANNKARPAGLFRGWGIAKNSKNPVAAGIFLRYYLDVNNYNSSSAFITPEAETFFFKVTGVSSANKQYIVSYGVAENAGNSKTYDQEIANIYRNKPDQVEKTISEMQNKLDDAVNKANAAIDKYTK